MKFLDFYHQFLAKDVLEFEQRRRHIILLKKKTRLFLFSLLLYVLIALFIKNILLSSSLYVILGAVHIYFIYILFLKPSPEDDFKKDIEIRIHGKILKFINPEWKYRPKDRILVKNFRKSLLMHQNISLISREKHLLGSFPGIAFSISFVHCQIKQTIKQSVRIGFSKSYLVTSFSGWHFRLYTNLYFKSPVVVHSHIKNPANEAENLALEDLNIRKKLSKTKPIHTENRDFNELFLAFSPDISFGKKLLEKTLTEKIIAIKKKFQLPVNISFVESEIFINLIFPVQHTSFDFKKKIDVRYAKDQLLTFNKLIDVVRTIIR